MNMIVFINIWYSIQVMYCLGLDWHSKIKKHFMNDNPINDLYFNVCTISQMKDDNNTSVYDKLFREYHLENIFVTLLIYELSFAGENFFEINKRHSKSIILKNLFEKCFDIIIKMMLHVIRKNNSIIIHKQNRKNKHCSI